MVGLVPGRERFNDPAGAVRLAEFVLALSRFPTGHLLDLGAGHGLFSLIAADLGWHVTAVDARDTRFPDDPRVRWVTADVREFDGYEDVTVVACLGLWYHLTLADQLALVGRIAPRPLILDTHVARTEAAGHPVHGRRLSAMQQDGGYTGRLYSEADLQDQPTASWGNESSFWPTVESLQLQLEEAGYDVIERSLPQIGTDREYFLARVLEGDVRQRLDSVVSRYSPLRDPSTTPPAPVRAAATAATGPSPLTARRVAAGLRRRLRRR